MATFTTSVDTLSDTTRQAACVVPDTPAALFGSFAAVDQVGRAAASLDVLGRHAGPVEWLHWKGLTLDALHGLGSREGVVYRVEVSPGSVAFRTRDYGRAAATAERQHAQTEDELDKRDYFAQLADRVHDYRPLLPVVSRRPLVEQEARRPSRWVNGRRLPFVGPLRRVLRPLIGPMNLEGFAPMLGPLPQGDYAPADDRPTRSTVRSWSAKSRANMVRRLATLDYEPLIGQGAPAVVTLTYPGDWLAVAPSAQVCAQHVRRLQLRFKRAWGRPLVGVWKREFQERGAPHYHILMVPPAGRREGLDFRAWLAATWVDVVGATGCGHSEPAYGPSGRVECCERHRHHAAHLHESVVDQREGARYLDPRRVGVYFGKHGSFAAKDYQNEAPAEWLADETAGIGRFWGVWGLRPVVAVVEVEADVSAALRRTARRWQAATDLRQRPRDRQDVDGRVYRVPASPATVTTTAWRKKRTVDRETGEIGWRWVRRRVKRRVRPRLAGRGGFLTVSDAPALVMDLGRYAELLATRRLW